jgi:hypothetical protein
MLPGYGLSVLGVKRSCLLCLVEPAIVEGKKCKAGDLLKQTEQKTKTWGKYETDRKPMHARLGSNDAKSNNLHNDEN